MRLCLYKEEGRIEMVIQDNGKGFDVQEGRSSNHSGRGVGLASMRERTELSGGSFFLESTRGKGTLIRATWPLEIQVEFGSSEGKGPKGFPQVL